jgi:hypothetical protein
MWVSLCFRVDGMQPSHGPQRGGFSHQGVGSLIPCMCPWALICNMSRDAPLFWGGCGEVTWSVERQGTQIVGIRGAAVLTPLLTECHHLFLGYH